MGSCPGCNVLEEEDEEESKKYRNMQHDSEIVSQTSQLLSAPSNTTKKESDLKRAFTPIPESMKQKLFYMPSSEYKFDRRFSFLPSFRDSKSNKKQIKSEKLKKCEALARITLILQKYQKWIRKNKCIPQKWDIDSDSDSDSGSSSDTDSDNQEPFPNEIKSTDQDKKEQVYNWINKELSENYNESRLLEDYVHLRDEHNDEYEQIHNHLCDALDKQIKPNDNFHEFYIQYQSAKSSVSVSPYNIEINIEKLLDEIQLYFAGIFDVDFFHQKYKVIKLIGTGIEGDVHKVKLRKSFDSFIIDEEKEEIHPEKEEEEDDRDAQYYAAKTIHYNERTMNNYRVMGKFEILDDFEMYIDKKKDKLILVSELWDYDIFDYMKEHQKTFNEKELYKMMNEYMIPLLFKLHSNHYIHCDIKPNNFVMNVCKMDDGTCDHQYGLIDFGTMLKMNEWSETVRSSLIGSMGYYAPEIIFQMYDGTVKIDTKCDIWALGLTIIYLLIGSHPLMSDDLNILGERKIKMKIDKCLEYMKKTNKISHHLLDLLNNMLQIEPLKRFNLYQIKHHYWITREEHMKKRLLFLDIDGVLNDNKSIPKTLKPELIMKLKKIINLSNCNIVLSSSWRRLSELKKIFKKQLKKIGRININSIYIGDTPFNGKNPTRCHEIMQYFEKNNILKQNDDEYDVNWCVVDDMDLLNENTAFKNECQRFLNGRWVQPNIETGLTDQDVDDIVVILTEMITL